MSDFPAWTPKILIAAHTRMLETECPDPDIALIERLMTDRRMRSVWEQILSRADKNGIQGYAYTLFDVIRMMLETPELPDNPKKIKEEYIIAAEQCEEMRKTIESTPKEYQRKNLISQLSRQETVYRLIAYSMNELVSIYADMGIHRLDRVNCLKSTLFIRIFKTYFMIDLGNKLWGTIGKLTEVILELPENTLTSAVVRDRCAR